MAGDGRIKEKEVSEDKDASQRHWTLQQRLRGRGAVGVLRLLCQRGGGGDVGERGAADMALVKFSLWHVTRSPAAGSP